MTGDLEVGRLPLRPPLYRGPAAKRVRWTSNKCRCVFCKVICTLPVVCSREFLRSWALCMHQPTSFSTRNRSSLHSHDQTAAAPQSELSSDHFPMWSPSFSITVARRFGHPLQRPFTSCLALMLSTTLMRGQAGRRCDRRTTPRDQRFHWSHQTPTDDPDLVSLSFALL